MRCCGRLNARQCDCAGSQTRRSDRATVPTGSQQQPDRCVLASSGPCRMALLAVDEHAAPPSTAPGVPTDSRTSTLRVGAAQDWPRSIADWIGWRPIVAGSVKDNEIGLIWAVALLDGRLSLLLLAVLRLRGSLTAPTAPTAPLLKPSCLARLFVDALGGAKYFRTGRSAGAVTHHAQASRERMGGQPASAEAARTFQRRPPVPRPGDSLMRVYRHTHTHTHTPVPVYVRWHAFAAVPHIQTLIVPWIVARRI
ncbi:hypothetical protein BC831DRAFT_475733 [Entophlyctis helioformis]|nr:hypothetical protein BC831DRAFT_475733 [Entophlyctis helioformis]